MGGNVIEGNIDMAKILVVDDDQAILDIIKLWLENDGHAVSLAMDGDEALDLLNSEEFDVMITDLIMPKTEGIQLILEIRRTHKKIGIIAISGGGRNGANYLGSAKKLGANAILPKPLAQSDVLSAVEKLLQ
jgi:CheY-like chemotaxis protein